MARRHTSGAIGAGLVRASRRPPAWRSWSSPAPNWGTSSSPLLA